MKPAAVRLFLPAFLSGVAALAAHAQSTNPVEKRDPVPAAQPCPQLSLNAPTGRIIKDGESIAFSGGLAGGDPRVVPTFVWSTSAGIIANGQGTRNVTID